MNRSIKKSMRIRDVVQNELDYIKEKYPDHHEFIETQARSSFASRKNNYNYNQVYIWVQLICHER